MNRKQGFLKARLARVVLLGCSLAMLAAGIVPARAQGLPPMSAILIDARTGQQLYAQNANEPRYPASLTKLMTLYLLFEALRDHRITFDQMMPVSVHAASVEPVKLGALPGSRITVQEAILGMVTLSANDAATIAGEFLAGGDETRFAALMTLKAHTLGMNDTVFRNASGLPNPNQVTTAHDLSILARRLIIDFPDDYHFFSTASFLFHGRVIFNHDHLLKSYPGADGMKTGYTNAAGHNLVTSAVRGGVRLIGVIMAAPSNYARDRTMAAMLDQGFAQELGGSAKMAALQATQAARQAQDQGPVVPATAPVATSNPRAVAANGGYGGRSDWSLDLGSYNSKAAAYKALRIGQREARGGVVHLAIARGKTKHPGYHAWIASVSEAHARAACIAMNHYGRPCAPVHPSGARSRELAER
ncbi:D-alanyl-D-alanine carboxypeptidase [Acidisoma silvae]|uniref:D-alanyl-D-alanine carboxypeptidase n=2 Tax=Acidisoma silvae TaxID=2802396 RepID=A0A964DX50_9PROT|nr:D-alanyl-D-alanine carboxypeptidase [Acidisoma silvae]